MDIFQKRFLEGENLTDKPYKILSDKNNLQEAYDNMINWKLCD
jgi:5-bromo-4-chloroindolyl phosphate hydrolysis protein